MASAVEVRQHPTKGRALHATRAFNSGATILTVTPLILIPSLSHISVVCSHCLKPGTPRACSRCQASYYCNAACQAAGWKTIHSKECKPLQKVSRGLPTPVRAVFQALVKDEEIGRALEGLEGHQAMWRRDGVKWKDMEMMAMGASAFAGKGTTQECVQKALDYLCKIQTNAFHRYDADLGQVGIFLEPTLAMANHSCIPNAMVQFIGRQAILRAESPIAAGDEIEISYTDYTFPLSKRREALAPYNFVCGCTRCSDDLNVYQACAQSPNIELNRQWAVPDLSLLRQHPASKDKMKISVARSQCESLAELADLKSMSESLDERLATLKSQYRRCRQLVTEELFAISPLPQLLTEISIYYAERGDFVTALAVSCHVAAVCDPYRYVAPFHPVRAKGLFIIAKLLSNTAADTAALSSSLQTLASKENVNHDQEALETLRDVDQVSLCQMLLIMIIRSAPASHVQDWELSVSAKAMLDDITQLPGREKELSLINAWRDDPDTEQSQAFFEFAVVKQIDALANLGVGLLSADFK